MSPKFKIKELDLNDLRPLSVNDKNGAKYAFIGMPGTGKTSAMIQYAYTKKHIFPIAEIFSGSEKYDPFYINYFPNIYIHDEYEEKALEDFQSRQLAAMNNLKNPWALMIADDSSIDKSIFNKPLLKDYYKNGRHWGMVKLLAMHDPFDTIPNIRTCFDGTFIMKEGNASNREKIWKHYASIIPKHYFNDFMDELTEDYHCIFINNTSTSKNIEDRVFYFKADLSIIPDNWKFGSEAYWDVSNIRYDTTYKPIYKTATKTKKKTNVK